MNRTHQSADSARFHPSLDMTATNGRMLIIDHPQRASRPMNVEQAANARREAEYVARRNGIKKPLLQLWKVGH